MQILWWIVLVYLLIINLTAVILTVSDKGRARKQKWRIPESTLIMVSVLGGSVAMYITMMLIRHKTKHPKFMIGIPLIFILQVVVLVCLSFLL